MIDPITLKQLSDQKQIDQFTLLREILQITFLNEMFSFPETKDMYFKGGTCLKLLYQSNRFSEDLDFSTTIKKNRLDSIVDESVKKMQKVFPGLSVKNEKSLEGVTKKIYLKTEISPQDLTIRLDFSQRENVLEPKQSVISTDLPIPSFTLVNHLSNREILAEKYRAIMSREKGRDIYDFWYLLTKKTFLDGKLVQSKLNLYGKKYEPTIFIEKIKRWNNNEIIQDVNKFLPKKDREILAKIKELLLKELDLMYNGKEQLLYE
ncbi:MAG: nucleotidyl transferase AbiEii/AbiGii toxin family protein [bacterium]|nr:nucleotidyl transferase AbiEii/AbiGii toxin family protein [bacterium]